MEFQKWALNLSVDSFIFIFQGKGAAKWAIDGVSLLVSRKRAEVSSAATCQDTKIGPIFL